MMEIANIILHISLSIFLLSLVGIGIYITVTEVKENMIISKDAEYAQAFYSAKSRQMLIEIVYRPGEYQIFDGVTGKHYDVYLPNTDYKVEDFIIMKFAPGVIFYKIQK